jgi:hypothetical protein
MNVHAKITNYDFYPMVDLVSSILSIDVTTSQEENIHFEFEDSIENLRDRFCFKIISAHECDFSNFIGQKCIVYVEQGVPPRFIMMGGIL